MFRIHARCQVLERKRAMRVNGACTRRRGTPSLPSCAQACRPREHVRARVCVRMCRYGLAGGIKVRQTAWWVMFGRAHEFRWLPLCAAAKRGSLRRKPDPAPRCPLYGFRCTSDLLSPAHVEALRSECKRGHTHGRRALSPSSCACETPHRMREVEGACCEVNTQPQPSQRRFGHRGPAGAMRFDNSKEMPGITDAQEQRGDLVRNNAHGLESLSNGRCSPMTEPACSQRVRRWRSTTPWAPVNARTGAPEECPANKECRGVAICPRSGGLQCASRGPPLPSALRRLDGEGAPKGSALKTGAGHSASACLAASPS